MTLRLRLLLVLIGAVAVGLLVAAVAAYLHLGSFLVWRIDVSLTAAISTASLLAAVGPATQAIEAHVPGESLGEVPPNISENGTGVLIEPGTFGELFDPSGTMLFKGFFPPQGPLPLLPTPLPSAANARAAAFFSVSSAGPGTVEYRAVAVRLTGAKGTVVIAIPLTNVHQTLGRLLIIEILVSVVVLIALGFVAWGLVRRELRPLDTMAVTARSIAAGDLNLTQRVTPADDVTEVGALGSALNTMLGEIEEGRQRRAAPRRSDSDASWPTPPTSCARHSPPSAATPRCSTGACATDPRTWPRRCGTSGPRRTGWG